jgi:flagellar basal-body rod protein FlgC
MDFTSAFAISAAGMNAERARLDVASINLANMHTTQTLHGGAFVPLRAVASTRQAFSNKLENLSFALPVVQIQPANVSPRLVYEPGHPDANAKGFVAYPGVDSATEMVNIMTAVRSYEANVVAINAAKSMALKALDIGSTS